MVMPDTMIKCTKMDILEKLYTYITKGEKRHGGTKNRR
jgi:hypothetical protein